MVAMKSLLSPSLEPALGIRGICGLWTLLGTFEEDTEGIAGQENGGGIWVRVCLKWRKYCCSSPAGPPHVYLYFHVYLYLYFHGLLYTECGLMRQPGLLLQRELLVWCHPGDFWAGRYSLLAIQTLFIPSSSAILCRWTFFNPLNPYVLQCTYI